METRVEKEHINCAGSGVLQRTVLEHSGKHSLHFQIADVSITRDVQLFLTESWGKPVLYSQAFDRVQLRVFADIEE